MCVCMRTSAVVVVVVWCTSRIGSGGKELRKTVLTKRPQARNRAPFLSPPNLRWRTHTNKWPMTSPSSHSHRCRPRCPRQWSSYQPHSTITMLRSSCFRASPARHSRWQRAGGGSPTPPDFVANRRSHLPPLLLAGCLRSPRSWAAGAVGSKWSFSTHPNARSRELRSALHGAEHSSASLPSACRSALHSVTVHYPAYYETSLSKTSLSLQIACYTRHIVLHSALQVSCLSSAGLVLRRRAATDARVARLLH